MRSIAAVGRMVIAVTLLIFSFAFSLTSFAQMPSDVGEKRAKKFLELSKKAEANGSIWVMISLNDPDWEPEGNLHKKSPNAVEHQRARVLEKQKGILRAIQIREDDPEVRLYRVGAISVKVNARQLAILRDHHDVADIAEPKTTTSSLNGAISRPLPDVVYLGSW